MKIAMWSGPRNLSTAMMFAFGARKDCTIWDEPFYAAYLERTGLEHPMRAEILAAGERDYTKVIKACLTEAATPVHFQKHMTQHMIDGVDRGWVAQMANIFLIRHPARVIASYAAKRENPTLEDIGFVQQIELIERLVNETDKPPVIIDSADIRQNPEGMLRALCKAIDLPLDQAMLSWPAGGNQNSGVWADHWYGAVDQSTGFAGVEGDLPEVPNALADVLEQAMPIYTRMAENSLKAG